MHASSASSPGSSRSSPAPRPSSTAGRAGWRCWSTLPIVFHCITILGFQTIDARVAIHSIVGSFLYGFLAVKLLVLKNHSFPSWALPVFGGTLFAALAVMWLTSSLWYFTEVNFGF